MLFKQLHKPLLTASLILWSTQPYAQEYLPEWLTEETVMGEASYTVIPTIETSSTHEVSTTLSTESFIDTIVSQNPEKAANAAFLLLEKGLYNQANTLFNRLQKTYLEDVALYGQSLIASQKGNFHKAFKTLSTIQPHNFDTSKIGDQLNTIALTQAQLYLALGNAEKSQQWLRRFIGNTATDEDRAHFSRIFTGLQTIHSPTEAEKLRVGILLPMSGELSTIGKDVYNAAQMALFERGIKSIFVYPHDTAGNSNYIESATNAALADGSQLIIGPLLAENTETVAALTRYQNIPILSFSSRKQAAGRDVYLMSYLPEEQAQRIAQYAADQGIKKVAALVPNTAYGQLMLEAFSSAAESLDMEFVRYAYYKPGASDHTEPLDILGQMNLSRENLKQEKALLEQEYAILGEAMEDVSLTRYKEIQHIDPESIVDFEALYIASNATDLPLLASQLAFYDMDASQIQLLGTGQWQDQRIFEKKGEYTRGALFTSSGQAEALTAFNARFEATYGYTPHPLAVLGYDSLQIVADVYNTEGANTLNYSDALSRREGFSLTSGPIRFHKNGLPERVYNIQKLRTRSSYTVQSAPQIMPPALPEPLNPLQQQASSVFDFFEGWEF